MEPTTINRERLFLASCIALVTTAMTFAIRAALIDPLGVQFGLDNTEIGLVVSTAFWGFTLAMIFGGALADMIGLKNLLVLAFVGHLSGILLTIFAWDFWSLFISTLLVGIGNGMVEAACNPLVATMYPDQKTKMLNRFHVWFPGGIVIGGLVAFGMDQLELNWQWKMASMLIPLAIYGFMFVQEILPQTERKAAGISTQAMYKAAGSPLFIFMVLCMLFTAATELGTNQWIVELLGSVGVPAILLLVFINGIMAIGRGFAGPIVHRLSPPGMLLFSAIFSAIGLYALSQAEGYVAFAAAAVFAIGICYFWPTMLGFVAEYIPKSGALGLSIMGGAGMLSVAFVIPYMGNLYDAQTLAYLAEGADLEALKAAEEGSAAAVELAQAQLAGGRETLKAITLMPIGLIVAFAGLFLYMRNRKPEVLSESTLYDEAVNTIGQDA